MELYGSLSNISGSVTASAFSGSFVGDGTGLYNLPASGVTGLNLSQITSGNATASISSTAFTVNKNTQIQGNLSVTGSIIANEYIVSSSVTYMTTSFASGSTAFGNDGNDLHQFTGSIEITGSISLNGQAIGTGKLDETTFQSYTSSNNSRVSALETSTGSLNSFTSSINTTIKSKLDSEGVISGSVQVNITGTTGYSTFSSSILDLSSSIATTTSGLTSNITSLSSSLTSSIGSLSSSVATTTSDLSSSIGSLSSSVATTTLNTKNRVDSIENKTGSYATTGSNLFIGTQTLSGSILPSVDNTYDLGSPTYQWRDVYISSGSLYIDGTKVLSSTAQELTITTDTGQSIKILEGTTDSIILQVADGDIELKSSGDGDILLDPTNGKIMLKGAVEILNGQKIQSSVGGTPVVFANDIVVSGSIDITGTIEGINLTDFSSSVNSRVSGLESGGASLNSYTSSNTTNINAIHTATSSLNSFTSSINTTIKSKLDTDGVISGSVQITLTGTTGFDSFSSSVATTTSGLSSSIGSLSSSVATTTLGIQNRATSLEGKTGSYATTGSNIFQGNQTITGSLYISQDLIIAGSSSIQNISSSVLNIADNIITVNAVNPSVRFGGLAVIDSGSSPLRSGSMLFDSVKDEWIFVHQNQGTITSSVLLMGPMTFNDLGNETYIPANRLVKSTGIEHLTNSNISDDGTTVTILSNAVVNGTFSATGTTIVSGSSQIAHDSTTGYVANRHIDHTAVSITAGNGLSGGGDISSTRTITLDTASATFTSGVKSKMNADGVVSGSSQVSFNGITDKPTLVSGSSQITYGSLSGIPSGIVSGSSQITFGSISSIPSGLVSGSSQIDLTSTTNYSTGIKTRLNAEGVVSGSAQITLTSGQVTTGLGFTPYNSTNPSGYISSYSETDTLATVTSRGASTTAGITVNGRVTAAGGATYGVTASSTQRYIYQALNTSNSVNSGYGWWWYHNTNGDMGFHADAVGDIFNLTRSGGASINGNVILHASNYTSYSPSLTGSGASGSWGISVTGSAGSVAWTNVTSRPTALSQFTNDLGNYGSWVTSSGEINRAYRGIIEDTRAAQRTPNGYDDYRVSWEFTNQMPHDGAWLSIMTMQGWHDGYAAWQIMGPATSSAPETWYLRSGINTTWNTARTILHSGNYSSYSPTLTGGGASGTWSIAISGNAATASSTGTLSSNAVTSGYLVIAGNYSNNAYNSSSGARLMFGGGNSDAVENYYIGTNLEDYGGNYTKLDLRWHTGIRMGAQAGYGGVRFFNNEDLSSVLFSIGAGDGNVRSHTNLLPSANNSYNLGSTSLRWANLYTNDLHLSNVGKEGGNEIDGTTGDWTIQEGEENLYIINHKNGKKFKIDLTEIN